MDNTILLVFEGSKTEPQIIERIQDFYFNNDRSAVICAVYGTVIYHLWKKVNDDPFLDLSEVLREMHDDNFDALKDLERDDIDQIYLFFDYDGHATNASDDKLQEMLEYFGNETENGKLYVSYPMVEALKDLNDSNGYKDNVVPCKNRKYRYKSVVAERTKYRDLTRLTRDCWRKILSENLSKANYIVNGEYALPKDTPPQSEIFDSQLEKYINPSSQVAVLSAFPFFLDEYFEDLDF